MNLKRNHSYKFVILILLILILTIFCIQSVSKYNDLDSKYNLKNQQYIDVLNNYNNIKEDYNQTNFEKQALEINLNNKEKEYNILKEEYKISQNSKKEVILDYNNLSSDYNVILNNYNYLSQDLNNFRKDIRESMDWFKLNSNIDYLDDNIKHRMDVSLKDCIICNSTSCKIKLACINLKNNKTFKLKYSEDKIITNKEDKLQSLQSFLDIKKGDCEDFSLLFASELRYITSNLTKDKRIVIEPIISSNTSKNYYIDEDEEWYYDKGIEGIEYNDYNNPYVACGNSYDLQKDEVGGHCFIILSKNKINTILDINNIDAIAIEPQNGMFIGEVNNSLLIEDQEYSIYLIDKEQEGQNNIFSIILEDDFLIYKDNSWESYNLFLESLDKIN